MNFISKTEWSRLFELDEKDVKKIARKFPIRWPRDYFALARHSEPILKMGRPDIRELEPSEDDLLDPVADKALRPVPFVVQKHLNRAIILCTKACHFYCRFCFRRAEPHQDISKPSAIDWQNIFNYFRQNLRLVEPILSGGDPLTLSNQELAKIIDGFSEIPHLERIRIHTRAPVHFPQRVNDELLEVLKSRLPIRMVAHFNHSDEISAESKRTISLFQKNRITVANQAVLLRGVNDSSAAQASLWTDLAELGVEAHHLHHPDRAPGNAQFRLTIAEGKEIFRQLHSSCSAPIPDYVLDLPDGSGKIDVMALQSVSRHEYCFRHPDGKISLYKDLISCPAVTIP